MASCGDPGNGAAGEIGSNSSEDRVTVPERRRAMSALALGAAGMGLAACGQGNQACPSVITRKSRELRMVTSWPKNFPGLGKMAERVAESVGALTDGQITVKLYAAGELVPAFQCFDAVSAGTADMYHAADYYWQSKTPAFNFFCAVPFGMNASEINGWIEFGGGQALWEELSGQFGVIAFQAGNTGHQMGGWFRKEINSVDDFRGLKMRIPGLGGEVIRQLGGTSETLPGGEIYQALQTGTIDATEWVGPWNDISLGFYRAAPYYYGPGFHEPGTMLSLGVNRKVWDSLDSFEKNVIRTACARANDLSIGEYNHYNSEALATMKSEYGVKLRTFPDDVFRRVRPIAREVRAQAGGGGGLETRIYESFERALKKASDWGHVSEGPYYPARGAG